MNHQAPLFIWRVAPDYRWKTPPDAKSIYDQRLEPMWGVDIGVPRAIKPMEEYPALFRNFAFTRPDHAGFLDYAKRFGSLTFEGLGYRKWLSAWNSLRMYIDIWDAVQRSDADFLMNFFERRGGKVYYRRKIDYQYDENYVNDADLFKHTEDILNATYVVQTSLGYQGVPQENMLELAKQFCVMTINEELTTRSSAHLEWKEKTNEYYFTSRPFDLHGALWLQFARSISHHDEYRRCEHCQILFVPKRSTARFCSAKCRAAAARAAEKKDNDDV